MAVITVTKHSDRALAIWRHDDSVNHQRGGWRKKGKVEGWMEVG